MPLIVNTIVKQEEVPKEPLSSFAELRELALQQANLTRAEVLSQAIVEVDPKLSKQLEEAAEEAQRLKREISDLKKVREALRQAKENERETGVALVVDGERKKVSKTSKYLLDMLTLDDQ